MSDPLLSPNPRADSAGQLRFTTYSSPATVSLDVTSICNFRCLHCFNNSGSRCEGELTDSELLGVAHQIAEFNCTNVCLCGGEPMCRKNVYDIIECICERTGYVNMVSNGSLINKQVAGKLKNSGLHLIQISLDGFNSIQHDTFRGYNGAFKKAVSAIQFAKEVGLVVAVSFVANKLNYNTFDRYIDLCYELSVSEVRLMPMIPMGRGSRNEIITMNAEEYIVFQQKLLVKEREYKDKGLTIVWGDPIEHYIRMPNNYKLGMRTYCMEIKANGDITVSTYLPIIVGNVRKHTLKEYWNAGYDKIWGNKFIQDYISRIDNIYKFKELEPIPYSGEVIDLNLI